jgi:alkyl hydroperoxide reductase subunit AhpC
LAGIKKNLDRIAQANTRVLALSVDAPERSAGFRQAMRFPFELLCDPQKSVVVQYHLLNPHEHDGIAYPAIFVIDPQGRICYRSLDRTASRVKLHEVLLFLEKLKFDQALAEQGGVRKAFIFPSPGVMWQIMQNMTFRGTGADWKHYVMFTFVYTPKNLYKLVTKPFRKN